MNNSDRKKLSRIEELERETTEYGDRLQFLKTIIRSRIAFKKHLNVELIPEETTKDRMMRGEPAVGMEGWGFPRPAVFDRARELEALFRGKGLINGDSTFHEYLLEFEKGEHTPGRMLEELSSLGPVYQAILTEALKPVFERWRELVEPVFNEPAWLQPYCYVCGGEPDMAWLEGDDNKRYLYCELCETSWYYLRFKCPFCENEDPNQFVSLSIDSDSLYALNACLVCKRYLKTVDTRAMSHRPVIEIESLLSSRLDIVTEAEGFTP